MPDRLDELQAAAPVSRWLAGTGNGRFQVPSGKYLEITSVEYTLPHSTAWAKDYVQSLTLNIRQRTGTAATNVLYATYNNPAMFDQAADDTFRTFGQFVAGARARMWPRSRSGR